MEYRRALSSDTEQITELVQNTIDTVYPKYYSKEAVNFFCSLHCKERILDDVKQGSVWVLLENNKVIGTGSCKKTILPAFMFCRSINGGDMAVILCKS